MLDSDLVILYGCKNGTKDIIKAVKRNIEKFPDDFYFQLIEEEVKFLRFHFRTLELKQNQYSKYNPQVFTEEGVAMLATVLRTENAASVSVKILRTFVAMIKFINENKAIFRRLTTVEYEMIECKDKIDELFDRLEPKRVEKQKIFFNGKIYDSYSLIIELIKKANNRIIIIDNYIDKSILDMLIYKKENVSVDLVISSHYLTKLDINRFNQRYSNLKIKY
ncbi:MAG: ORF6N domain-containing protein [Bacilli bacterium]|nr:ORF6N domain-containing protein [Bacilli bacterium]